MEICAKFPCQWLCSRQVPVVFAGAGASGTICVWDLRYMDGGPLRLYEASPVRQYKCAPGAIVCLAREPRHGTLIAASYGGMYFWDWETGTSYRAAVS